MSKLAKKKTNQTDNLFNMNLLDFLSHELKTPLSTLRLNIEFIQQTLQNKSVNPENIDNKLDQFINIMDAEVEAMIQLISDMVDLRQIDENTITLKQNWCPWSELIESVQKRVSTLCKKNTLKIQTDNKTIKIYTDPVLFKQALINLILNATEHSPENSTIEISLQSDINKNLIVSVKDQGLGIKESEIDKIFIPFYKRPRQTHLPYKNSGLGLSIVKKIVESQGGTIKVVNHPSGGALFSFTLPQPNIKK